MKKLIKKILRESDFDWVTNLDTKTWESEYLESISDDNEDYRGDIHDLIDGLVDNGLDTSKIKKIKLQSGTHIFIVRFTINNGDVYGFGLEQHISGGDENYWSYQVTLTKNYEKVFGEVYYSNKNSKEYFMSRIPKFVETLNGLVLNESFDWVSDLDTKKWESEYLESISDVDEDYRGVIHDLIGRLIDNELDTSKIKGIKLDTESGLYDVDFIVDNGDKYYFGIEQHGYNWDEDDYTYQVTLTKNDEMVLDDVYHSPKDIEEYFISRIPKVVERLNHETLNESMGWVKKHNEPSGEDITGFIIKNNVKEWRMGEVLNDNINLTLSSIEDLGNLEKVNGNLSLTHTSVKDLGELRIVKGSLDLRHTEVKSLGKLKYVGGNLTLRATSIEDLGNLEHVGGSLDITGTPLSKNTTEEEIHNKVGVYGSIFMY